MARSPGVGSVPWCRAAWLRALAFGLFKFPASRATLVTACKTADELLRLMLSRSPCHFGLLDFVVPAFLHAAPYLVLGGWAPLFCTIVQMGSSRAVFSSDSEHSLREKQTYGYRV